MIWHQASALADDQQASEGFLGLFFFSFGCRGCDLGLFPFVYILLLFSLAVTTLLVNPFLVKSRGRVSKCIWGYKK